jgi:UMF1 family MFS transporter
MVIFLIRLKKGTLLILASGDHRKRLLLAFGFTGGVACMLFLFVVPQIYLVGALLTVISVTCLGSSFVLLNSYLPLLAGNDPSIRGDGVNSLQDGALNDAFEAVDSGDDSLELDEITITKSWLHTTPALQLSNQISAKGVGSGYAAAVLVQIFSIGILLLFSKFNLTSSTTLAMRVVLLLVGLWWALFTVPTAMWLRKRPGPPLPAFRLSKYPWLLWISYIVFAWHSLWKTVKVAIQLRQVVLFLIAWFLLSDAVATVSGTAILFARTELRMGTAATALLSITATTSGIAGAYMWPIISKKFGLQSHHTIIACIALFEIVPLYGLLGFVPFIKAWGVGGLQQQWEIYPLGVVHGFVMGGLSSFCRSFYGVIIPPGFEASFYALYAVTDKGSSVIGPAIVGRIVDTTGSIRAGFWFLAVLIVLPAPLIWKIDAEKGRKEAVQMAETLKGRIDVHEDDSGNTQREDEEARGLLDGDGAAR